MVLRQPLMRTSVATLVLGISLPLVTSFSFPGVLPGSALRRDVNVMGAVGRALPRTAARCNAARSMVMADDAAPATVQEPFVAAGMTVENFWERCVGTWTGLRSSHSIAFGQIEQVNSDMKIVRCGDDDEELIQICKTYGYTPSDCVSILRVSWESTSDWDDHEKVTEGSSVVALVKTEGNTKGKVLRSKGYTEEIPAAGDWIMKDDGSFYMKTIYSGTGAEETFWFPTPDLRMRTSCILSQGGKGVTTATFTTEIRQKEKA
ncbi:CpeS-like protein-domain-containing protein [Baffinella frigidus]|nr:CpeS-like protein-domain-containing protein [Cryptophyta sp. CCMP2293]